MDEKNRILVLGACTVQWVAQCGFLVKAHQICKPKNMKTLLLAMLVLAPIAHAEFDSAGFQSGNDFQSVFLRGEITVSCRDVTTGQNDFATYRCVSDVLEPADYVRFQGPAVDADKVSLSCLREDGSVREKSEKYSSGLSKGRFNLWTASLTQRPLLKFGRNVIDYTLTKSGAPVTSGQFIAQVTSGQERTCSRRRHYFSNDMRDCRTGQSLCARFFNEENHCK